MVRWRMPRHWKFVSSLRLLFAVIVTVVACCRAHAAAPVVLITNLPPYGFTNDLAGRVLNANSATQAVAVFIFVPGYGWVSKPTCVQPLTPIQPDGSWSADITTGGGDTNATRVAALLVGTNYNQPCVLGLPNLPTNVYAQASAKAVITRAQPGVRFLNFSGYDWWVKNYATPVGPGPNYFSDSTNNVWTDTNGWLHLRITHRSNAWQCAEIVSARTFGYGDYRFELNSPADALDPNITLGLFTWSDDPAYTYREIDVECGRWNVPADTNNAQFVVQPYNVGGHLVRYRVPPGVTNSTHLFNWQPAQISHASQRGPYYPNPNPTNVIATWSYALTVPQTGDENVRLNLWLFQGAPPTDNQESEVILKNFQFVPPGTPKSAVLRDSGVMTLSHLQLLVEGEPDWRYQIQTSTNLTGWLDVGTILATNDVMGFTVTNAPESGAWFFRTVTLP